ncbi:MAG: hypothetical protein J4428_01935 [Candidatus Aenigmarchaeota archaeon]|nr:hypothetical protein [Candidatus Aenigmarchaeota archaeon]
MNKKHIKKAYIFAAVLSLVLYLAGIFTGFVVQNSTLKYTEKKVASLQRRVENLQLEYIYLSTSNDKFNCKFLSALLDDTSKDMWLIRDELVKLESNPKNENSYNYQELKREYSLVSTRAWILNSVTKEKCDESVVVVLYFYSVPCERCLEQGNILDELKSTVFDSKLRVFVLDIGVDEPIVKTLKSTYLITETPSLVVGNQTLQGFVNKDMLRDLIYSKLE